MGMTFSFNAVGDELVSDENIVYDDDTYYSDVDPEAVEGMDDTSDIEVSGEINPSYSEATVEIDNIYNGEVNEYTDGEEYENVTYYDDTANVAGLADGLVMDPASLWITLALFLCLYLPFIPYRKGRYAALVNAYER